MKIIRVVLFLAVAVAMLSHISDGQQARPVAEQLRLAGVMPRGALVYVQARDLSALMKAWLASTIRDKFYQSASFGEFAKSRIYLKFQAREKDFEDALGFGIDENRLAELAGGAAAVSIYDIGKLEIVFVTEVARERAIATTMFKQLGQFQERPSPNGAYYTRDVATDGGRLNQQFCFAYTNGKLIVTTTEGLMIRALGNAKAAGDDSLMTNVMAIADQAKGFTAHEVTMWLDQARLNRDRLFNSYWIHHNVTGAGDQSIANIESGLLDLRITPQGMTEQRWFKMGAGGQGAGARARSEAVAVSGNQTSALLNLAPADAQLVEIHPPAAGEEMAAVVSNALFGKLPESTPVRPDVPDRTRDSSRDEGGRTERYSRLDARFEFDVDDDLAPDRTPKPQSGKPKPEPVAKPSGTDLAPILTKATPVAYGEIVRSKADAGKPFVHFERAIVIEMKSETAIDRAALERAMSDEMRARFVVAGVDPRLAWQDDAGVRYLAQSLLEQGAAYAVSGKYLVLASNKEFVRDVLQAALKAAALKTTPLEGAMSFYAVVRVADAKPVFDKLMGKLDGKIEQPATPKKADNEESEGDQESENNVKFFSDNISSLVSATTIREVRIRREGDAVMTVERIVYTW
jgi:hypothetical protein